MSDQNPPETTPYPTEEKTSRRTRWRAALRERAGRTRKGVVLAVAGALLLGGVGGFAIGALTAGDRPGGDRGDWPRHHSGRLDEGQPAPPAGVPGQLPPATDEDGPALDG